MICYREKKKILRVQQRSGSASASSIEIFLDPEEAWSEIVFVEG